MFKIYIKYIIKKFLNKFIFISLIFLSLIFILNIFEEISFFKNISTTILTPYFLTFLNTPIILFELFPFIFLLSTQLFLNEILIKNELTLLKNVGLSNLKIITTLFFFSVFIGFLIIVLYYNLASKFKFYYTDIKNNYSNDNNIYYDLRKLHVNYELGIKPFITISFIHYELENNSKQIYSGLGQERWQSGRMRRSRKPVYGQTYRGFESLPLRHI